MKEDFKPYIPAEKVTAEFTVTSVIMGIALAVIFGAANAYLGLRVGMTVSASIPAAVISMGVIRKIMKRDSILENNMVQTIGSAGESLASGVIFTMPALFLWAREGIMEFPRLSTVAVITLFGGVLGVLFMVPLRNALIVQEHGVLPYPEGTACAEVLLAGEKGGASAKPVFLGMGFAAVVKLLADGLKVVAGVVTVPLKALKTEFSAEVYPALLGVGYICGPKISAYMFCGGLLGWFVLIPVIALFGAGTILYPGTVSISGLYAEGGPSALWSNYIRYIGAGAVAAAGIISLIRSMPLIVRTFIDAIRGVKLGGAGDRKRTELELDIRMVLAGVALILLFIWLLPMIPLGIVGAILIVIFGFFFGAVSSRMVGMVGSSNNPVSGMAIATLLIATTCLRLIGEEGSAGFQGAIAIGTIICIVASMAGDTSQDLKTGFLLGATPKKQQIGELIGAVAAALSIGGIMILLDKAWGFGSAELSAPQATLMKMLIEGVMDGNLPWGLIFIGVFLSIIVEILGIPSLAVAIGLYLPLELTTTIMIGGIIRWMVAKKTEGKEGETSNGILFCSGLIAGEGLVGIFLAILAVVGADRGMDISGVVNTGQAGGIFLMLLMIVVVYQAAVGKRKQEETR